MEYPTLIKRLRRIDANPPLTQREPPNHDTDRIQAWGRGRARSTPPPRTRLLREIVTHTQEPIVELHVDVIVNAANKELEAGGGVCGAIHVAAGEQRYVACRSLAPCGTGGVKATLGFYLPGRASMLALKTVCEWLHRHNNIDSMDQVILAFHRQSDGDTYMTRWYNFVHAPPPAMIRLIGAADPNVILRPYVNKPITCGRPT
jgi:hypothetical protein